MGKVLKILAVVVAVAVIIFAPQLAPALLAMIGVKSAIAVALLVTAATIGASMLLKASGVFSPKPSARGVGTPQVINQSLTDSYIIYGKRRTAFLKWVFFHAKKSGSAHYRYFVFAVAGHRCQGNPVWFLNEEQVTVDGSGVVTSGKYAGAVQLWFQRGLDSETANATFVSECDGKWTSAHKGNNVAAIYMKAEMTDAVVEAGFCTPSAVIEGKDDIYDPRDDTTGYKNNAALVFYDWLALPREEGGFGAYDDEIPDDAWISAQANVSDESVEGEARYALDGVIVTGAAPVEIRDSMIACCAGSYTYSGGKHLMRVGYWVPPSGTLSEDDLDGPIQVSAFLPSDVAANEVQGSYIEPEDNYQAAAFATQTLDTPPADVRQTDLDLAFVTSKHRAERIARIMLNRAQCEKMVVWPMNIAGLKVRTLDTWMLGTARYGLSNYAFQVTNWDLSAEFGVVLRLREENEDIYGAPEPVAPDVPDDLADGEPVQTSSEVSTTIRNSYPVSLVVTTANVGGDGRITIGSHTRDYPGDQADVAIIGATLTGLTPGATYYPYYDDETLSDTTPTFAATTVYADALNSSDNPYRHFLNRNALIPASSGDTGTGGGSGGGYGGGGGGNPIP